MGFGDFGNSYAMGKFLRIFRDFRDFFWLNFWKSIRDFRPVILYELS